MGGKAKKIWSGYAALAGALFCLAGPALAQNPVSPGYQGAGYEVVSGGPVLELHFHGISLKSVHADDAQSALSLDFNGPVDGAVFDRLSRAMPQWIAMAYSNYDNGVIRAARPVTFLTRQETDGFSLRIVPRDGAAPAPQDAPAPQAGPPPYPPQPYPPQPYPSQPTPQPGYPPPAGAAPQIPYAPYTPNAAARNYYGLQYAVHRDDPLWGRAYDNAAIPQDSQIGLASEYHRYHNGDAVIGSRLQARVGLGNGVALIGSLADTDTRADTVRAADGSFIADNRTNDLSGSAGLALNLFGQSQISLEGLAGNHNAGARLGITSRMPEGFTAVNFAYHLPYTDTPEAVMRDAFKDEGSVAFSQGLGSGLWLSLAGRFDNYGIHDNASTTRTAGWDGTLRWDTDLGGLAAGLAYDGHGEYRLDSFTLAGAAPTPYVPLSIRNIETHAFTASLSSMSLGGDVWFDLYGGYILDRYGSDGAIYGAGLHYRPMPGLDLELGGRHATVSLVQGEVGAQTSIGLHLNFGLNGVTPVSRLF